MGLPDYGHSRIPRHQEKGAKKATSRVDGFLPYLDTTF
jgi:hypothetical protein